MSDDYEPALDIETTASEAADDIGGDGEGAPVEAREVVRDRGVKETTRKLFADAAKKLKPQLEAGEGDELEPAITDDQPAAAAAAPEASATSGSTPQPAAAAPAPDPVAQTVDTRAAQQLELERKSFDDERKAFEAQRAEWDSKFNIREKYAEDPAGAIMALVKEWTGAATDDEVKDEVADLVTLLSSSSLGAAVPEHLKIRIDSKRALRQVKNYKADQAKRDAEAAKKAETERQQQQERAAIQTLNRELASEALAKKYPHLAAEDDPGGIVWDVIKTQFARTGVEPNWEEMAQLADAHFKKKHDAYIAKRRHLLAPAAPQAPVAASEPQGDPQSRRSSTLTNKTAAPVAPSVDSDEMDMDREAHRRRSLARLRGGMKESTT